MNLSGFDVFNVFEYLRDLWDLGKDDLKVRVIKIKRSKVNVCPGYVSEKGVLGG